VGRAPAVLGGARSAAFAGLAALLAAYYASSESLWNASTWWDVALLALVLIPAVFGLVYLVLPLLRARGLLLLALSFVALAAILTEADLRALANFAKLAAVTTLAFWFLGYFDSLGWIVTVAAIVPWVDAWSVWRGPTHVIVSNRPHVFTTFSFAFPVPGEHGSANLGLPDLLFFALFLAAAARWRLRVGWTWLAMVISFGATMAIAAWLDLGGLPALPGLSIAFFGVNGDLIWRYVRGAPLSPRTARPDPDRRHAP
jgi:hypothetical protein